jgi:hypothetical protein
MKKLIVSLLSVFVLFVPRSSLMQENGAKNQEIPIRSPVRLLPGYRLQLTPGVEGGYGVRIWRQAGLSIFGNTGCCFAAEASSVAKDQLRWQEEQEINGKHVTLAYTKDQDLIITFTDNKGTYPVNFTAHVRDEHEVADTLLIVLTYEPSKGYPVQPEQIVAVPLRPE